MKLYTEEQVIEMVEKSRQTGLTAEYLILTTTPIELPSDEEIDELFPKTNTLYEALGRSGMIEGAKWMRDKIQGGDQ